MYNLPACQYPRVVAAQNVRLWLRCNFAGWKTQHDLHLLTCEQKGIVNAVFELLHLYGGK